MEGDLDPSTTVGLRLTRTLNCAPTHPNSSIAPAMSLIGISVRAWGGLIAVASVTIGLV